MVNEEIIDGCPVTMFCSGYLSKLDYPYRMEKLSYSSPTTAAEAEAYILDSSIENQEVSNRDVLDRAGEIDANIVVAKDYMGEPERTLDSTMEMLEMARGEGVKVLVPIQRGEEGFGTWAERTEERVSSSGYEDMVYGYGIGGLRDASADTQVEMSQQVRDALPDKHIHFFGGGFSAVWAQAIREQPGLVDSMDASTALQEAMNGKVCLPGGNVVSLVNLRGKHSTIRAARIAELSLLNWCYAISPFVRQGDIEERLDEQLQP